MIIRVITSYLFNTFKDHMLLGSGVKGFRYLCANKIYTLNNENGCTTHPHNTYIQILVSNGLIGFLLIVLVFFYVLREIFICRIRLRKMRILTNLIYQKPRDFSNFCKYLAFGSQREFF